MAENLKCKCGAVKDKVGQPFTTASFHVHILQEARKDGKGIHGWATTKESSNPVEVVSIAPPAPDTVTETITLTVPAVADAPPSICPDSGIKIFAPLVWEPHPCVIAELNLERRAEEQAIIDSCPPPGLIAAIEVEERSMLEQIIDRMVVGRAAGALPTAIEAEVPEVAPPETEPIPEKSGVPRGVFLILAFVAVVGVIVLWVTQT